MTYLNKCTDLLRTHANKSPIPDKPMISLSLLLLLLLLLLSLPAAGIDCNRDALPEEMNPEVDDGDAEGNIVDCIGDNDAAAAGNEGDGNDDDDDEDADSSASAGVMSNKHPLGTWTAVRESFDVTEDTNIHSESAPGAPTAASVA